MITKHNSQIKNETVCYSPAREWPTAIFSQASVSQTAPVTTGVMPLDSVAQRYTARVIKSCKHKGLQKFYETGSTRGIQLSHSKKLRMQLAALNTACSIDDKDIPGYRLHPLKGDRKGNWSNSVSGNWRLTFEFTDGSAYIIDYEDYH